LRAAQVDLQNLHISLESGEIDLAIGEFPLLIPGIRRQKLFSGRHMCIFQKDHPRLGRAPTLAEFMEERHVFITAAGTGHPHQVAERSLGAASGTQYHCPRSELYRGCHPRQDDRCGGDHAWPGRVGACP
jgi:DNA-binding transcriptional LysR family regulator